MSFLDRWKWAGPKRDDSAQRATPPPPNFRDIAEELHKSAKAYIETNPEEENAIRTFMKMLNIESKYRYPRMYKTIDECPTMDAKICLYVPEDRMSAYVCVFPPSGRGENLTEEKFRSGLHFEGVRYGIRENELKRCVAEKRYLEIIKIARGTHPRDGEDGELKEFFPRDTNAALEVAPNETIDFSNSNPVQTVRKGDMLCRARFPVPGIEGTDVTGEVFPCHQPEPIVIPAGKNTCLSQDGTTLFAAIDGILYMNGTDYCVRPQRIFSDNLTYYEGELKVEGDLYIPGDICGGAEIEAYGDIIISGEVRDARIVSKGGSIRVQKGIHGSEGKTYLLAARQIQALEIVSASVDAKDNVIAEIIMDSDVRSGGSVSVIGGRGVIMGGHVRAAKDILCQQIGNQMEKLTKLSAGYIAGITDEYERVENQLTETAAVLGKLWENIGAFRKFGNNISQGQKELLGWLVEQRGIYEQEERSLKTEKKELSEKAKACGGRIACKRLYPVVEVQVGLRKMECRNPELDCRIQARDGIVVLR